MLPEPIAMDGIPTYPPRPDQIPSGCAQQGRYRARYARTAAELDAILRLRFDIFNLELGEGLASSEATGRDLDRFDQTCHHLLVEDTQNGHAVVGTYRIQTVEMAHAGGFYSAGEFDLSAFPREVLDAAVEVGRACIAKEHRNRQVLFLLWKGLALYMTHNAKRYLFGCCSLTSQDPAEGERARRFLVVQGHIHPSIQAMPLPGFECSHRGELEAESESYPLPVLFRTYLRYRAQVVSPPAIDRDFKTIDFLVLFDVQAMDKSSYDLFFESGSP